MAPTTEVMGFDGTRNGDSGGAKVGGGNTSDTIRLSGFILRFVAIIETVIAAIVVSIATDSLRDNQAIAGRMVNIEVITKLFQHRYFIAVNIIAAVYSVTSLGLSILKLRRHCSTDQTLMLVLTMTDVVMLVLLLSGNATAIAARVFEDYVFTLVVGFFGISPEKKLCHLLKGYCRSMLVSIALSMLGGLAYLVIVILAIIGVRRIN